MQVEQNGIEAKVVNSVSGLPVAGVSLYCRQNVKELTISDDGGNFKIPPWKNWQWLPFGADAVCEFCNLVATAPEYHQMTQEISCIDRQDIDVYYMNPVQQQGLTRP